jgi:hypothetical protein
MRRGRHLYLGLSSDTIDFISLAPQYTTLVLRRNTPPLAVTLEPRRFENRRVPWACGRGAGRGAGVGLAALGASSTGSYSANRAAQSMSGAMGSQAASPFGLGEVAVEALGYLAADASQVRRAKPEMPTDRAPRARSGRAVPQASACCRSAGR